MSRATRATIVALGASIITTLTGPAALAERPAFRDHIRIEHELHEVADLTASCGFPVWHTERINLVLHVFEDGTEKIYGSFEETLVNLVSGETLDHRLGGTRTLRSTRTVDGAQLTIELSFRHTGLTSRWSKRGDGVLLQDAGLAEIRGQEVIDLSQDPPQVVDRDVEVIIAHGPHPGSEMTDQEFFAFVCAALS